LVGQSQEVQQEEAGKILLLQGCRLHQYLASWLAQRTAYVELQNDASKLLQGEAWVVKVKAKRHDDVQETKNQLHSKSSSRMGPIQIERQVKRHL